MGTPEATDQEGAAFDSAWSRFCSDTAASARVWRQQPALPILTVLLWTAVSIRAWSPPLVLPLLPLMAFVLGFFGVQREWYARAFAGERPSARRIWTGSWRYFVRLLPVGLVVCVLLPFFIVFVVVPVVIHHSPPSGFHGYWVRIEIVFVTLSFVLDLLLTFVMPALVFTTANPFRATRIGFRYLRRVWRSVKWHALVPPTTILAVGQLADGSAHAAIYGLGISLVGAMLGLLFKGAQLRAYFDYSDQLDVSIDGFARWTAASSSRALRKRPTRQQRAEAAKAYEARWPT